jgi:hypothetical protein
MSRDELTLAIAAVLVGAVLAGWVLHAVFRRLNTGAGPRSVRQTAEMASRLHAAEEAQLAAEIRLRNVEGDLKRRLAETETDLSATLAELERTRVQCDEIREAYRDAMAEGGPRSRPAGAP